MKHDLEAFSRDIVSLIKTSGDSGDSGDKLRKSLRENGNFVPTRHSVVSPLASEWGQHLSTSGDKKIEKLQRDTLDVPTVPTVPTCFQPGPHLSKEPGAPVEWAAIIAELHRREPVEWLSGDRWCEVVSDAEFFIAAWGEPANNLGWCDLDLFGVHPAAPSARLDAMGLVFFIRGGAVVAMTDQTATIRRKVTGSVLTYRRQKPTYSVCISQVMP